VRCRSEAGDDGLKRWRVGVQCGVSGGTERQSREWDEVRWGAAVLGVPFIVVGGESNGRKRRGHRRWWVLKTSVTR
jgi:hypothetical protein